MEVKDRILSTSIFVFSTVPNKACTGRWGFCGIFKHFSDFEFFILPSLGKVTVERSYKLAFPLLKPKYRI